LQSLTTLLHLTDIRPSVIAETWHQRDDELLVLVAIPSYTLISSPKLYRRGGGVGFYISDHLLYHPICEFKP